MGFFKRLGKKINRGVFQPIAKVAEKIADVVEDVVEEVVEEVIEKPINEIKKLPKEVADEMEKIAEEIQKLERKHKLLKYGGDIVGMGLKIGGALSGNPALSAAGIAIDVGTEIASEQIRK